MYSRLGQHLNINMILTLEHFGLKKNSNTSTAIYSPTENILKVLNENRQIVGIFCDTAKAFDSVNHDILLDKLCYYGTHVFSVTFVQSLLGEQKKKS